MRECATLQPSTSDPATREPGASTHLEAAKRYLMVATGCVLFAAIYAQFSHGVHSPFMTFMFAIPLLGGAFVALVCRKANVRPAPLPSRQAWALAIACLTVASCLRGIFEIAGTASALLWAYPLAAAAFAILAAATFHK